MSADDTAPKHTVLFLVGGDEPDRVRQIGTKVAFRGSTDLYHLLGKKQPFRLLHVTRNILRHAKQPQLAGYECFVNLVTEPETGARTLEDMRRLLRGLPGRVINRPEAVLQSTRERVARRLASVPGLLVPRAIRLPARSPAAAMRAIDLAGLKPPIILRPTGTHGGKIVGCFDDFDSLRSALDRPGEHVAIQFVDFRSPDGLYRKYRAFFIGRHIIARHKLISDHWNVHANDRTRFMAGRPELVAEEQALFKDLAQPFPAPVSEVLCGVRERMGLDFFGMDFALTADGRPLLFEANATMSFFPFSRDPQFAYLLRAVPRAQHAFRELLGLPIGETLAVA